MDYPLRITSIAPCLVLFGIFLIFGTWICTHWPFYRDRIGPGGDHKIETLEGLRAYLALGVFFHHGIINYFWIATGKWDFPPSKFYSLIGPYSVNLFFMITGFLFWTKAIRGPARLPARKLWIGRVLRVGPMYLLVSFLVYGTIFAEGGFRFRDSPREVAIGLLSPLTLGLFKWRPIAGVDPMFLNARVNWSLQYEWGFYLVLPLLAILAKPTRFPILILATLAVFPRAYQIPKYWTMLNFISGMAVAHTLQSFGKIPVLSGRPVGLACLGLLGLIANSSAYGYRTELGLNFLSLSLVFLCVAHGNTFFGIMTTRGAKLLGMVSYSIYLIHGYVLYLGTSLLVRWTGHETPTPAAYWAFLAACGLVTILVSATTYRFVEHPFIGLSHRSGRRLPEAVPPAGI